VTDNDSTTTTPRTRTAADTLRAAQVNAENRAAYAAAAPDRERRALLLDLYHHFAVGAVETQIVPYDTAETFRDRLYQEIIR